MPKSAGKHKEANQLSGMVVHNLIPIGENFALNINLVFFKLYFIELSFSKVNCFSSRFNS